MRRLRTISPQELSFKIQKVPCRNKECKKEVYLTNSLNRFCSVGCKVKVLGVKKVQQKAKKPIRKVSEKQKERNRIYTALRTSYLYMHPICEVEGCNFKSRDIHHKYDGADRQKYFLNDSTWMAVCRVCHRWIHEHSIEAKEKGYLK